MYTLKEVKQRGLRHNSKDNNRLMFCATKISIYFSWIFINLGLSANQVTGIFFLTGLIGSLIIFDYSLISIVLAYLMFRLHIVFDVCDGEVARFNQQFSINGAYWDYMIHALLYPMYFFGMTFAIYSKFNNIAFLLLGTVGVLVVSLMLAVKNNYFRAKFFNNHSFDEWKQKNTKVTDGKFGIFNFVSLVTSFEGLFIFYILLFFINSEILYMLLFSVYIFLFALVSFVKFIKFTKYGYYTTRS